MSIPLFLACDPNGDGGVLNPRPGDPSAKSPQDPMGPLASPPVAGVGGTSSGDLTTSEGGSPGFVDVGATPGSGGSTGPGAPPAPSEGSPEAGAIVADAGVTDAGDAVASPSTPTANLARRPADAGAFIRP
jgi:hypothetical protein